jgi:hypothetical protein
VKAGESPDLLSLVKPLTRMVKDLPEFVSKTQQISATAQAVLRAIKAAREPDTLLFADIPAACGFAPFEAEGKLPEAEVSRFIDTLRAALTEMQRAYPQLMAAIQNLVLVAFEKEGSLAEARRALEHEARLINNLAVDPKLKAFLNRAFDLDTDDTLWLEMVASLLTNKAPEVWDDQDRARFEAQLASTARTFRHFRVLVFGMMDSRSELLDGDPDMLRIGVTFPHTDDLEKVVCVPPDYRSAADQVHNEIRQVLADNRILKKRDVSLAVLGELVQQLLSDDKPKSAPRKKRSRT